MLKITTLISAAGSGLALKSGSIEEGNGCDT